MISLTVKSCVLVKVILILLPALVPETKEAESLMVLSKLIIFFTTPPIMTVLRSREIVIKWSWN